MYTPLTLLTRVTSVLVPTGLHFYISNNSSVVGIIQQTILQLQEFVSDPVLFANGTFRLDIQQRNFGTCWFLSMLSTLADKPDLCKQVCTEPIDRFIKYK